MLERLKKIFKRKKDEITQEDMDGWITAIKRFTKKEELVAQYLNKEITSEQLDKALREIGYLKDIGS